MGIPHTVVRSTTPPFRLPTFRYPHGDAGVVDAPRYGDVTLTLVLLPLVDLFMDSFLLTVDIFVTLYVEIRGVLLVLYPVFC